MKQEKAKLVAELEALLEDHQTYIKVLEVFSTDPHALNKKLNDVYCYIIKKLMLAVRSEKISQFQISLYHPIKTDLYGWEAEWNAMNAKLISEGTFTVPFSWDFIRPYLYETHSQITRLLDAVKEKGPLTGIDKTIEELNERRNDSQSFYITKKGDDFYYKGRLVKISKDRDCYKVFCILYARARDGGEVLYRELIPDIKTGFPKNKNKTNSEIQKFIVSKLTDKTNGFMHYAKIDPLEDNQKPLLSVSWGKGIFFNNRAG
jgi:hypothetical protein